MEDLRTEGKTIEELTDLESKRDKLYGRLERGYKKIESGLESGANVEEWETLWLTLLNEYEEVCNQLQRDLAV